MSKTPDSTVFPHWENPHICCACALLEPFHEHDGVMYYTCPHAPAEDQCICDPHHPACPRYIPKKTD